MRTSLTHLHQRMKRFEYLIILVSALNILHYFMFLKWIIGSMLIFVLVLLRFEKNLSLNFNQKLENNFVLCSFLFVTNSLDKEKEFCDLRNHYDSGFDCCMLDLCS